MTAQSIAILVSSIVFLILIVASTIGRILAFRDKSDPPSQTIINLNERIDAWWVLITVLWLALYFGLYGVLILFAFASFSALREFLSILHTRRSDHFALCITFFIVLPFQYLLIGINWYGLYSIFIPVFAFLGLPMIVTLRADTKNFMKRVAETQWALMTCVFCLSHVPALLTLNIPEHNHKNPFLIVFLLSIVQGSDVLQYISGKLFGKHKVAPKLSPSKTVEGLVGGGLSAIALGAGLFWMTPFTPLQAAGMAAVIVLLGFGGGLVLSAVKRDLGVKDWGDSIAGHGGFIDRLDSIIFAAPVFFHLVRYFFTP